MIDRDLKTFLDVTFPPPKRWPKPLHLLQGALEVWSGADLAAMARSLGTSKKRLEQVVNSNDPVAEVIGHEPPNIERTRTSLGGLIRGRAAEIAFEDIYKIEMGSVEFDLVDLREGRSDTDYRLKNGGGKDVYRLNIKFFGRTLDRAAELVGLTSSDCFPLATYKIQQALQKQEKEHIPYVFVIVGVEGLTNARIASAISASDLTPLALLMSSKKIPKKRDLEDRTVDRIVAAGSSAFTEAYNEIRAAQWYALSARRAEKLLHELLFERVFALRVPSFTRQFSNAEVDMHFSLQKDLTPLTDFLHVLRSKGQTQTAAMLERGTI